MNATLIAEIETLFNANLSLMDKYGYAPEFAYELRISDRYYVHHNGKKDTEYFFDSIRKTDIGLMLSDRIMSTIDTYGFTREEYEDTTHGYFVRGVKLTYLEDDMLLSVKNELADMLKNNTILFEKEKIEQEKRQLEYEKELKERKAKLAKMSFMERFLFEQYGIESMSKVSLEDRRK